MDEDFEGTEYYEIYYEATAWKDEEDSDFEDSDSGDDYEDEDDDDSDDYDS